MVVIFALWLLYRAVIQENKRYFVFAGIAAGLLPMIHTHSFLAFGIIAAVWFAVYLFQAGRASKDVASEASAGNKTGFIRGNLIMKWLSFIVLLLLRFFRALLNKIL
jgi:hypothetical protein